MFQFKLFKNYSEQSLAVLLGVIILSLGLAFITLAWTEPSHSPPTGDDVAAPINVSDTAQRKAGRLGLGIDPASKLHVKNGSIRVDNGEYQSWGAITLHPDTDNSGDDNIDILGDITSVGNICLDDGCKDSWSDISGTTEDLSETLKAGNSAGGRDIDMGGGSLIISGGDGFEIGQNSSYCNQNDCYYIAKTDGNNNNPDGDFDIGERGSDNNFNSWMHFEGNGNVGIGLTNPGEKLDVEGGVKGNELCIDGEGCKSSWSDIASVGGDKYLPDDPADSDVNINGHAVRNMSNVYGHVDFHDIVEFGDSKLKNVEAYNDFDMIGNNVLNGSFCPDGSCDVNNYETFTSSGIGVTNIYDGSGGEIDFQSQVNMNGNTLKGLRKVYGDGGSDILFYDRPRSEAGLYIHSGTAYFNGDIRVDHIQDRGGGSTIYSDSHWDWNNHDILDANEIKADSFIYTSDERLKENINPLNNSLEKVSQLEGISFDWKENGEPSIGFTAQNVEKVFPEAVSTGKDGLKGVNYGVLTAPLIESVKAQQEQINDQEQKIEELEERTEDQQEQIDQLKEENENQQQQIDQLQQEVEQIKEEIE